MLPDKINWKSDQAFLLEREERGGSVSYRRGNER